MSTAPQEDEVTSIAAAARQATQQGDLAAAALGWRRLIRAEPDAARWRLRLIDVLGQADDAAAAETERWALLEGALASGAPLAALLAALDLGLEGLGATFEPYLAGSARLTRGLPPRPPVPPLPARVPPDDPGEPLPSWPGPVAGPLAPMPLLSLLDASALDLLAPALSRVSLAAGQVLVREGAGGDALFLVADGALEVVKDDPDRGPVLLGRVAGGGVLGEMALVLGRPRAATLRAAGEAEVVRIGLDALREVAARHPAVATVLEDFTRQRLLATLVDTSPLFRELSPAARHALLGRFEAREVPAGAVLVDQGQANASLWLVVDGEVEVHRAEGGAEPVLVARLGTGAVFGEITLLTGQPATATVRSAREGRLDVLSAEAFAVLRAAYPEIAVRLEQLGADRVAENRFIFEDDAFFEDAD